MARPPTTTATVRDAGGKFTVDAEVTVHQGAVFNVDNTTDYRILVALPDEVLPADPGRKARKKRLEDDLATEPADFLSRAVQIEPKASADFTIPQDAKKGHYSYQVAVFAGGGTEPAAGNSPPKIIVEA